ncbi:MAG TPA: metallophosphoesterase [Pyrinomonadaceae bacterium]|nr:metallophosphoesterase [Pyrinomonadaceae bacterium]
MSRHFVISDLHLGMGRRPDGEWHPLEDFKSDASFKKFLDSIEAEADELIINGDWIDFTQLEPFAYHPGLFSAEGHRLGWTQEESLAKLESCKRAHEPFFQNLKGFLHTGKKVTIIMGNHDPDLFWPDVQKEIRRLLQPSREEQLEMTMTYVRRGSAHIEHGNQYCSPENKFYNPHNVFHDCTRDGQRRLELVWGSVFVMEFLNPMEEKHPYADNIKTTARAIWLGIKNGWVGGREAAKFVKFLWGAGIPWDSLASNILSEEKSPDLMIRDLRDRDIAQGLMHLYERDVEFRKSFDEEIARTSREEWMAINSIDRNGSDHQQPLSIEELTPSTETEEAATLGVFRENPEVRGAESLFSDEVKQVIFGHTHTEIDGAAQDARVENYFNTGTWVNSMDLSKRANRLRLENISEADLKNDALFDLRLRTAVIEIGSDNSTRVSLRAIPL